MNGALQAEELAALLRTRVLGFEMKVDMPIGEHRWLTVASRGQKPTQHGPVTNAIFEDTRGNLIGMPQV